jgi:hypothetical protein
MQTEECAAATGYTEAALGPACAGLHSVHRAMLASERDALLPHTAVLRKYKPVAAALEAALAGTK